MVAFLLFLILLVLMFGPSHVFFWGICLIAAAIVVLAVGLGLAALWWVWSWAGSISPGEILAALLVVPPTFVCLMIVGAGYNQLMSDEIGHHREVLGLALIAVAGLAFFSMFYVSFWSCLIVILAAAASLYAFACIFNFNHWFPEQPRQAVQIIIWYSAIAVFVGGAYGGFVAAQWLRFLGYLS